MLCFNRCECQQAINARRIGERNGTPVSAFISTSPHWSEATISGESLPHRHRASSSRGLSLELVRETALAACAWARERENSGGLLHVARHAPSRGAGEGGRAWRQAATPTPTAPFVSASEVIPFLPFKCADSRGGRAPMSPSPPSSHLWCVLSIPGNLCQKKGGSACMLFKIERFPLPPRRRRERCRSSWSNARML